MKNARDDSPSQAVENLPPDWAAREKELLCPLCGYNLRGLTESRCPECGFKFTWQELLDAEKDRQIFLFEYGRNIPTFWKTYWRTCRPRQFWREINPAIEVRWTALIIFWILSSSVIASFVALPYVKPVWRTAFDNISKRSKYKPVPGHPNLYSEWTNSLQWAITSQEMDDAYPLPWHLKFWHDVEQQESRGYYYSYAGNIVSTSSNMAEAPEAMVWCAVFLAWPILTLITLMIFRISMRQAKIRMSHLVRAVVYSCDFGLLVTILAIAGSCFNERWNQGLNMMAFAAICAVITSYRLTIAFREYIRAHMPFATVLASQLIALLITFVLVVQIADFSRSM
jgi:hypothetical protein